MLLTSILVLLLVVEVYILIRMRPESQTMRILLRGVFGLLIIFTLAILTFSISYLRSPENSLVDQLEETAQSKQEQFMAEAESAVKKSEELASYADCISVAETTEQMDECRQKLSPELQTKMAETNPDDQMFSEQDNAPVPLLPDCARKESLAEKTICENPKLMALNEELAKHTEKRRASRSPINLRSWWKTLLKCDDDFACLEKELSDEIVRATQSN